MDYHAWSMPTLGSSRTLIAAALVALPLAVGFVVLRLSLPSDPEAGVFVYADNQKTYRIPVSIEGRELSVEALSKNAVVVPHEGVTSFFVVAPGTIASLPSPESVQLYRLAVTYGVPDATPALARIPVSIHRVNARAYRVRLEEKVGGWWGNAVAAGQYANALARTTESRATTDVLFGLILPDPVSGLERTFVMRFGPE
jgi:hypothetical protein